MRTSGQAAVYEKSIPLTAPRRTPVYSPVEPRRTIGAFDLRVTRDLSSRRLWREGVRNVARTTVLLVGDTASVIAATAIGLTIVGARPEGWLEYLPRILVIAIFGQGAAGTYGPGRVRGKFGHVLRGVLAAQLALWGLDILYRGMGLPVETHVALAAAMAVCLIAWRGSLVLAVRAAYAKGIGRTRTLVVADRDEAWGVIERFRSANERRVQLVGHVVPGRESDPSALGTLAELARVIEEFDVKDVVIASHLPREQFRDVIHTCFLHGTAVSIVPGTLAELPCRVSAREVLSWPLIELEAPRVHMMQVAVKRSMDILVSFMLLSILSPVLLAIGIAVKLDSRGPMFFRQRRPGLGGRRFGMLKFRTMRADAEAVLKADPALYKKFLDNDCKLPAEEDPRISRLGRFLRATSLDELPQLINVLVGDMSLIGPRPVVGPELTHYGDWMPTVLAVRPGMTGYWQVAGRSHIVFPERAHLDVFYVTRWSLGLDLKILALTVPAVLRRAGAH